MSLFLAVLSNNILPAFMVMGAGVLLDRTIHVDKHTLSRMALYLLTPCLVFSSITQATVDLATFGQMALHMALVTAAMIGIGLLVGRLLGWSERTTSALVLTIAFLNAGNLGLSVCLFTYGQAGLDLAIASFVTSNLFCNTLGAYFAARGSQAGLKAVKRVLKMPAPYAFALALLIRLLGWNVPSLLMNPIELVGRASVPTMLLLLGIQISQTRLRGRLGTVGIAVFIRLVIGAIVAFLLAPVAGLQGLARQVAITEGSTPTAVVSGLMAIEFDADADLVSSVIFASTLLSSVTLTVLMLVLG